MLGMMDKGGGSQMMPQGQNSNLAALFRGNTAAGPASQPQQIPQIMAPARPAIGLPPQPGTIQQTAPGTKYIDPQSPEGRHQRALDRSRSWEWKR